MAIPNPPEDRPNDEPVPGKDRFERDHTAAPDTPVTSGTGLSVALSVAFYVIVLAIGIGYDHAHRLRSPQSGAPERFTSDWLASVRAPQYPLMPFDAIGPIEVLLAQAHDCALAAQWNCVDAATHTAIALRGDLPEAQTQLAQTHANAMWVSSGATLSRPAYFARGERLRVAAHVGAPYERWRHDRMGLATRARRARVHPASPEFLADLYRH
jgi:hypothetical protein